ncbi:MAG: HAD-IA family hydrolase [Tropicimonas sp.]|uniref:HAD-IA family hydrolase n=1 Tax=Tropicimonas sp. TaxID=2067044 RepID=UPI003A83EFC7
MTASRLVLFDVDGTLVDSQVQIMAAMTHAFEAIARPVPPRAEVLSLVGLSLPLIAERLLPDGGPALQAALVAHYRDSFSQIRVSGDPAASSPLFPGARAALERLVAREGVLLGVATGKSKRGLDHLLRAHGLSGIFVTEQVADFHPSKPHPSMILAALSETGVEPAGTVMIGDTCFDMEMGRAAGVRRIGVGWGYHPPGRLAVAGAERVIEDFAALDAALDALWEG